VATPKEMTLETLEFAQFIRPGDAVIWGQVSSEPLPLTSRLMAQRASTGGFSVFLGATYSDTVQPAYADHVRFRAIGGNASNGKLAKAGVLEVIPVQLSNIAPYIEQGFLPCDVALVQLTEDPDGNYRFAVGSDYIVAAASKARVVIGEVNAQAPRTFGPHTLPRERVACVVRTDRPVLQIPPSPVGAIERQIATHISRYIDDGTTLQMGIGSIPEAVMSCLTDRRELGIHSGMIGDSLVDLIEAGAVTNDRKPIDRGKTVTGMLGGTDRLYRFADRNPQIVMHTVAYTHGAGVLATLPKLVSINGALEVDLTGQVNSEVANGLQVGAVGGALDYVRGAHRSVGGRSIIALPSTARNGALSRIVVSLNGPVSTSRSDVDVIVTEYGAAELRGRSLSERIKAMIRIAHPDFRDALSRQVFEQRRHT
jgi:acyl-CoA hydrolase